MEIHDRIFVQTGKIFEIEHRSGSRKLLSALIRCHFDYIVACPAWHSGLQKTMKHKLQILQNKTIRLL